MPSAIAVPLRHRVRRQVAAPHKCVCVLPEAAPCQSYLWLPHLQPARVSSLHAAPPPPSFHSQPAAWLARCAQVCGTACRCRSQRGAATAAISHASGASSSCPPISTATSSSISASSICGVCGDVPSGSSREAHHRSVCVGHGDGQLRGEWPAARVGAAVWNCAAKAGSGRCVHTAAAKRTPASAENGATTHSSQTPAPTAGLAQQHAAVPHHVARAEMQGQQPTPTLF